MHHCEQCKPAGLRCARPSGQACARRSRARSGQRASPPSTTNRCNTQLLDLPVRLLDESRRIPRKEQLSAVESLSPQRGQSQQAVHRTGSRTTCVRL